MKIGIELRQIHLGSSGGITLYIKELFESLFRFAPEVEFTVFSTIFNKNLFEKSPPNVKVMTLPTIGFFSEVDKICIELEIDILFRSYPMQDELNFPISKQIFLVPDIQHEIFPNFFAPEVLRTRRLSFNRAMSLAGAIATLSKFTRQTIIDHDWTQCKDIFIAGPSIPNEESFYQINELDLDERKLLPNKDFFFYPANLWPHKNHRRILQAFRNFLEQTNHELEFVFSGHPEGWSQLHKDFSDLPIRHTGFVNNKILSILYKRCRALVFFSLYEGFGMPLLEAFKADTPVICSNTTSLPEVGGKAILTCDPTNIDAMSNLMALIIDDSILANKLISEGKKQLTLFTWNQSAANLYDAAKRVLNNNESGKSSFVHMVEIMEPLVTIVTPSFNQGDFLKRTIDSVLSQTYKNIEYIVIDGGSTDNSVNILKSYNNKFFKWISEPDHGQSDAINKGFSISNGEIRAYLNSDDILLCDAVEKVVNYFYQHPECDLLYGQAEYINKNDKRTGMYNTADYSFDRLITDCCICQPAAFWKTRIANKVGPFKMNLKYVMDYDYWLRIDRIGGCIKHIKRILAASRLYPETKTLSGRRQIYREIFHICLEHCGYVDFNYFLGLWHHLICEADYNNFNRLPLTQRHYNNAALIHFIIFHLLNARMIRTNPIVIKKIIETFHHVLPDKLSRLSNKLIELVWPVIHPKNRITGYWEDNWLAPRCRILLDNNNKIGKTLYLEGIPPVDMKLIMDFNGGTSKQYFLKGNEINKIEFVVNNKEVKRITLKFTKHIIDAVHRKLSFKLSGTNMFSENNI